MVKAIKEAEVALRIREENKKKSEDDSELNQARTVAFQEIEKSLNERKLKVKDLGQYSNYQERINSLGEVGEIRNFREEVLGFISKLGRRDNNPSEHPPKPKLDKQSVINEINNVLNKEPKITNEDLNSDYRNWEQQITNLDDYSAIINLKDKVIIDIEEVKKGKKSAEHLNNIFEEAQTKTGPELDQAINNADQEHGSQAYEDNKEQIKELKEKKATENPEDYRQKAKERIVKRMAEIGINEQDLNEEGVELIQLNDDEITEPTAIVEEEMKVIAEVEKAGATKKLNDLLNQVKQFLDSKIPSQEKVNKLKNQLLEFMSSSNIYHRASYNNKKSEVKTLLSKLESYSDSKDQTNSPNNFP
jgi:hypothetical protein